MNKNIVNIAEDEKEKAWEHYNIMELYPSFGEPTYQFEKGDAVICGNLKDCIIDEKRTNKGLVIYGFTCKDRNGQETYMYAPWYRIRPIPLEKNKNSFTQEDDIDIRFSNTSLESLLNKYYLHGVNMNPDYQRDYVWDDKDKESLLDSIFNHIEIGKFAFIHKGYESNVSYEILDGKQRLSTLLDFYENRLSYKGVYFNDLSAEDRYTFLNTPVTYGETSELTKGQIYKYFYTLNRCGKVMDEEQLSRVKAMYEENKDAEEDYER